MAFQGISTGTGPNQGDGDTLVEGAVKINANFTEVYAALVPLGGIIMWSGTVADIAGLDGWELCDGTNGTPDLQDRFIVGAGSGYGVGATGGAATVTLTTAQMPSHNHSASTSENGSHTHGTSTGQQWAMRNTPGLDRAYGGNGIGQGDMLAAGSHQHTITVGNTGGSQAHENRPPYYALAFIMRIA